MNGWPIPAHSISISFYILHSREENIFIKFFYLFWIFLTFFIPRLFLNKMLILIFPKWQDLTISLSCCRFSPECTFRRHQRPIRPIRPIQKTNPKVKFPLIRLVSRVSSTRLIKIYVLHSISFSLLPSTKIYDIYIKCLRKLICDDMFTKCTHVFLQFSATSIFIIIKSYEEVCD